MNQNVEKNAKFKAAAATFVSDNELDETELRACQGVKNGSFSENFPDVLSGYFPSSND